MPINVNCDCGKSFKVADSNAGRKFRCKACQAPLEVPSSSDTADEFADFRDEFGDEYPAEPVRTAKSTRGKRKPGRKKKAGKSSRKSGGMAPAIKYGIAGGIVTATVAIVMVIVANRGDANGDNSEEPNEKVAAHENGNAAKTSGSGSTRQRTGGKTTKTPQKRSKAARTLGKLLLAQSPVGRFYLAPDGLTALTHKQGVRQNKYKGRVRPAQPPELIMWDLTTGKRLATLEKPVDCDHLAYSPRSKRVAGVSRKKPDQVLLWNSENGKFLKTITITNKKMGAGQEKDSARTGLSLIAFTNSGQIVGRFRAQFNIIFLGEKTKAGKQKKLRSNLDAYVRIDQFPVESMQRVLSENVHRRSMALAVSPTSEQTAVGVLRRNKAGKTVGVIELRNSRDILVKSFEVKSMPWYLTYSADGSRLAAAAAGQLIVIDTKAQKVVATHSTPQKIHTSNSYEHLALSQNGRYLLALPSLRADWRTAGARPRMELWDLTAGKVELLDLGSCVFLNDEQVVMRGEGGLRAVTLEEIRKRLVVSK